MDMPKSRTLPGLLRDLALSQGEHAFVYDGKERLSYAEFQAEVSATAGGLHAIGVRHGDRVAVLMGNRNDWLVFAFAAAALGAIMVAMNTWWRRREIEHALKLSGTSVLVMANRYLNNDYRAMVMEIEDRSATLPELREIVSVDPDGIPGSIDHADLRERGRSVPASVLAAAAEEVSPDEPAFLLFTSGSTAHPKAVPLTHRGLIENMHGIGERMHLSPDDRFLVPTTLFWSFSCANALFAAMTHGCSIVLLDRFDAGELFRLVEEEQCTVVYTQPNMVLAMHAHPGWRTRDLSRLRTGICRPQNIHLMQEIGPQEMVTAYGLTEVYGNCSMSDCRSPIEERRRGTGRPLPNTEVQVVDPVTHEVLPPNTLGEFRIRGYVMTGYYDDPETTATVFDEDGWFYSGDSGITDSDGILQFRGRLKEVIKSGGINISPLEVEELLQTHRGIRQAVVVGIPDRERDEIVAALIVPHDGVALSPEEIQAFCRKEVASYKVPRFISFTTLDDVPLTDTAKVAKRKVQERLIALREREAAGY